MNECASCLQACQNSIALDKMYLFLRILTNLAIAHICSDIKENETTESLKSVRHTQNAYKEKNAMTSVSKTWV